MQIMVRVHQMSSPHFISTPSSAQLGLLSGLRNIILLLYNLVKDMNSENSLTSEDPERHRKKLIMEEKTAEEITTEQITTKKVTTEKITPHGHVVDGTNDVTESVQLYVNVNKFVKRIEGKREVEFGAAVTRSPLITHISDTESPALLSFADDERRTHFSFPPFLTIQSIDSMPDYLSETTGAYVEQPFSSLALEENSFTCCHEGSNYADCRISHEDPVKVQWFLTDESCPGNSIREEANTCSVERPVNTIPDDIKEQVDMEKETVPKCRLGPAPFKVVTNATIGSINFNPPVLTADNRDLVGTVDSWSGLEDRGGGEEPSSSHNNTAAQKNMEPDIDAYSTVATVGQSERSVPDEPEQSADTGLSEKTRIMNAMKVMRRQLQRWHHEPPPSPDTYTTVVSSARKLSYQLMCQKAKELGGDDSIGSIQYTPVIPKQSSKFNGTRSDLLGKPPKSSGRQNSYPLDKLKRKESIIELEIREQMEREKDFSIQKELIKCSLNSTLPDITVPDITVPTSPSNGLEHTYKNGDIHNSENTTGSPSDTLENGRATPDNTDGSRSPTSVDNSKFASWYASESPIERDIRITREREEALKFSRQQQMK